VERAPQRPGDARDAQFDSAKARAQLHWAPETPLSDGIRATYDYFERLPPGY
jgi:nucleoside-diphosphate-sugar epimerase